MELCDLTLSEYIHDERAKYIRNCIDTSKLSTLAVFVQENCSLPLKLQNLWTIMNQIARGVDFIHKQRQVHGDLKPRNGKISFQLSSNVLVMFSSRNNSWKIGDFGTAAEDISEPVCPTRCQGRGTACYRAPELIAEKPVYSTKTDIWGLGCILFELATAEKAFKGDWNVYEYAQTNDSPKISVPTWPKNLELHLSEIVCKLLAIDWDQRPYASEICETCSSYTRLLDPEIAQPVIDHTDFLPYAGWKQVIQLPDEFELGCKRAEERQKNGDEETASKIWDNLVGRNSTHQLAKIPTHLSLLSSLDQTTTDVLGNRSKDKIETLSYGRREPATLRAGGRNSAIKEVRDDLFARKPWIARSFRAICGIGRPNPGSRLKADVLVPALLEISTISSPPSPVETEGTTP